MSTEQASIPLIWTPTGQLDFNQMAQTYISSVPKNSVDENAIRTFIYDSGEKALLTTNTCYFLLEVTKKLLS